MMINRFFYIIILMMAGSLPVLIQASQNSFTGIIESAELNINTLSRLINKDNISISLEPNEFNTMFTRLRSLETNLTNNGYTFGFARDSSSILEDIKNRLDVITAAIQDTDLQKLAKFASYFISDAMADLRNDFNNDFDIDENDFDIDENDFDIDEDDSDIDEDKNIELTR